MTSAPVRIAHWGEIEAALESIDVARAIERGFVSYSAGDCVVPPVGELLFEKPRGEVHIKYGYVRGGEHYVVKIASGFYGNPERGLPPGQGMMLLFRQATGEPACVLLDEGRLTDIRTAAAGAVAARLLAPRDVARIGVFGTGTQARLQLAHLRAVTACRDVIAWGRNPERLAACAVDLRALGYTVETTSDAEHAAREARLIVTATASRTPLFGAASVRPGTHITAMGSDTPGKQELDPALFGRAELVVCDSLSQCRERGEVAHGLKAGSLAENAAIELGRIAAGEPRVRRSDGAITIVDLTGVAVQDLAIAEAVYARLT